MSLAVHALRVVGATAAFLGYVHRSAVSTAAAAGARLLPYRGWRNEVMDGIALKLPPAWGEVEHEPTGPVVHNRPRRFRVDGDAVWYSSAVELRVRDIDAPGLSAEAPMTEVCRIVGGDRGKVVAAAMANGVSPAQRRVVDLILRSARPATAAPAAIPSATSSAARERTVE